VRIDEVTYGHMTPDGVGRMLEDFLRHEADGDRRKKALPAPTGEAPGEIRIGLGSCCIASGSAKVQQALTDALIETGVTANVKRVGCVGMCHRTPLVEVLMPGRPPALYARVEPDDAKKIVLRHFRPKGIVRRIGTAASSLLENVLTDEVWEPVTRYSIEVRDPPVAAFLDRQRHIATRTWTSTSAAADSGPCANACTSGRRIRSSSRFAAAACGAAAERASSLGGSGAACKTRPGR